MIHVYFHRTEIITYMRLPGLNILQPAARRRRQKFRFNANPESHFGALLCLVLMIALTGCDVLGSNQAEESGKVIVFAAASLTESFNDIARQFEEANPGVSVVLNLAGSQQLAHQLSQGAPADVFASADEEQMTAAIQVGRVRSGKQQPFAGNQLSLIIPANNPGGLRTLSDLARPGLHIVLAAPEVPAGRYAKMFIDAAADDPGFGPIFKERVMANIVSYEENVRAVLSKVRLGEADAGIVYHSDAAPNLAGEINELPIPEELNVLATYSIAPLSNSESPQLARKFIDFVLSAEGQDTLAGNGLKPVATEQ